jgi:ferredoxin-thioredoxin reductase catalytic subunit
MGILADLIYKKANEIVERRMEEKQPKEEGVQAERYNRLWLDKVVREFGYAVSDNDQKVDNILKALNKRDGHCPCGGMTDYFLCPCEMMRGHGVCKCGLFKNFKDVNPTDTRSTAKIKD